MNLYSIFMLMLSIISVVLIILTGKLGGSKPGRYFILCNIALSIYTFFYALELNSHNFQELMFFVKFEYIGIAFGPAFMILMAIYFDDDLKKIPHYYLPVIFVLPIITIFLVITNDMHHFYYRVVSISFENGMSVMKFKKGLWYYIHMGFVNFSILLSAVIYLKNIFYKSKLFLKQNIILFTAATSSWIPLLMYFIGLTHDGIDIAPIGYAIASVIYAVGLLKYNLANYLPIAMEHIFYNVKDGFIIIDKSGTIINYNPAAYTILNTEERNLQGKNITDVLPNYRDSDVAYDIELLKDGRSSFYQVSASEIMKDNHNRIKMVTLTDITSRVTYEKNLVEANLTKDKFLSIIAHDLKGPLGSFIQILDLMNIKADFSVEKVKTALGILDRSAKNIFNLLDNLLKWSAAQRGDMNFNPKYIDVNLLILSITELFDVMLKQKNLQIKTSIVGNLKVYADIEMFGTVLRNLINNAVKFSNPGCFIHIKAEEINNFIEISVRDEGIGMSQEQIEKLFRIEAKSQSAAGTRGEKGTGLGLILCKEFVGKMGGSIHVESTKNVGSKFYFTVPATAP